MFTDKQTQGRVGQLLTGLHMNQLLYAIYGVGGSFVGQKDMMAGVVGHRIRKVMAQSVIVLLIRLLMMGSTVIIVRLVAKMVIVLIGRLMTRMENVASVIVVMLRQVIVIQLQAKQAMTAQLIVLIVLMEHVR